MATYIDAVEGKHDNGPEFGQLPRVVLDVSDTDLVDDELYELLLDAFLAKALSMGYDVVDREDLVLGDWVLTAQLEYV